MELYFTHMQMFTDQCPYTKYITTEQAFWKLGDLGKGKERVWRKKSKHDQDVTPASQDEGNYCVTNT